MLWGGVSYKREQNVGTRGGNKRIDRIERRGEYKRGSKGKKGIKEFRGNWEKGAPAWEDMAPLLPE